MRKAFLAVLMLALCASAAPGPQNWQGWLDTVSISDTLEEDTVKYTSALPITDGEDLRVICKVNDTSSDGFASDSIKMFWGYQLGNITLDSAGSVDTAWDDRITVDTLDNDSLGTENVGSTASDGTITRNWGTIDTTHVTGYGIQSRWLVPEWGVLIRYWVQGMADNNGTNNIVLFEQQQRKHSLVGRN